jgi:hypothetical protein
MGLAGAFGYPGGNALELARVSQYVSVVHGSGPLGDELHDLLTGEYAPGAAHRLLAGLPRMVRAAGSAYPLLVSTAYDTAPERAFAEAGEELDIVTYVADGTEGGRFRHIRPDGTETLVDVPNTYTEGLSGEERTVLLRLHGGFDPSRDRESFLVTEDDHIEYLLRSDLAGLVPVAVAARLRRSHILFLACTPTDWCVRALFSAIWRDRALGYRSWAVSTSPNTTDREFWRHRGVDLVDLALPAYIETLERHAKGLGERGLSR